MTARILFVTGTDTNVGKTVAAASICAEALQDGQRVRYVKPVQTGVDESGEGADAAKVANLVARLAPDAPRAPLPDVGVADAPSSAFTAHELVRYPLPVAPSVAAAQEARPINLGRLVRQVQGLAESCDLLVVEGAGGLLVPLGIEDTIADMARRIGGDLVVVGRAGLGTLNHVFLTLEAARARHLRIDRIILTPWPDDPGLTERENLRILRQRSNTRVVTLPPVTY